MSRVERDDADVLAIGAMRHEGSRGLERRSRRSAGHALAGVQREHDAEAQTAAGQGIDANAGDPKAVLPDLDAAGIEVGRLRDADDVPALREGKPGDGSDLELGGSRGGCRRTRPASPRAAAKSARASLICRRPR